MKKLFLLSFALLLSHVAWAQLDFYDNNTIEKELKSLAVSQKSYSKVSSIGKSAGGQDLWMLTLSETPNSPKPALVLVAGADGKHPAGTTFLMSLSREMVNAGKDSLALWLEGRSVYIIPSLNPDALNSYKNKPYAVRSGNATATDDDRDGRVGDDPYEDLNNDGFITQMRVEDPTGEYILSSDDARLLVKADMEKGELGKYQLLTEGIDNDRDGKYNEDGSRGVNIDRNFAYEYPIFSEGAGPYMASEDETRAFLELLNRNQEIYAVINIGPANNLSEAVKYDSKLTSDRILKGWLEKDAKVSAVVSKLYNEKTKLEDAPKMPLSDGSLSQTVYYHAGKYSFSTPGWWLPTDKDEKSEKRDSTEMKDKSEQDSTVIKDKSDKKKDDKKSKVDDTKLLEWTQKEQVSNVFFDWKEVDHPDFPGQKVEVGGVFPLASMNPPRKFMEESAAAHLPFVTSFLKSMPMIEISPARVESLGGGVSRVTVKVYNRGLLPTYSEVGEKVRFTSKMKAEVKLSDKQQIISGRKMALSGPLNPGEHIEYSWLISGKGDISIEAGCATAGRKTLVVNLK